MSETPSDQRRERERETDEDGTVEVQVPLRTVFSDQTRHRMRGLLSNEQLRSVKRFRQWMEYEDVMGCLAREHPTFENLEGSENKPTEVTKSEWEQVNQRALAIIRERHLQNIADDSNG